MVKLRLQRVGRKNDPSFRLVATDSHNGPQSGKFIEILGSYDPRKDSTQIKPERIKYWMSQGAQVSPTVHNILVNEKVVEGKKINVLPKKSPIKSNKPEEAEEPKKEPKKEEGGEAESEAPAEDVNPPAGGPEDESPKAKSDEDGSPEEEKPAETEAKPEEAEPKAADAKSSGEPKEEGKPEEESAEAK